MASFEVSRGGQMFSTQTIQKGDIVVKPIFRSTSRHTRQETQAQVDERNRREVASQQAIETARQEAIQKQIEKTETRRLELEAQRKFQAQLKSMSVRDRNIKIKEVVADQRARNLQAQKDRGARLTPGAERQVQEAQVRAEERASSLPTSGRGEGIINTPPEGLLDPLNNESGNFNQGVVRAVEKREFKERPQQLFEGLKASAATRVGRATGSDSVTKELKAGVISSSLGFASPVVSLGTAIINPVDTAKALGTAITNPVDTARTFQSSLVTSFKTDPSFAAGALVGEAVLIKSPTLIPKGVDIIRTGGLKRIPTERIVAPEFFKGQTFPLIKKGQTAGSLLREFKKEGAGFTASPVPFKKVTTAGKGTSEIGGVFQAPRVSPRFLRVGGEERKLISLSVIDTLRPSVTRITPTSFKLATGVSPKQSRLAGLKQSKTFIETKAPKGQSTIPFIKTEKESIITAGTELRKTGRSGFFEFEGRKVPIAEFEALGGKAEAIGNVKSGNKLLSISDISKSSSRGRIGKRGLVSPLEIVSSGKSLLKSSKVSSSRSSSRTSLTSSGKSLTSKSDISRISSVSSRATPSSIASIISSRASGRGGSSGGRGITGRPVILTPPPTKFKTKQPKQPKTTSGIFGVQVRRRGKFRTIGKGLTLKQAASVGKRKVGETLAATFKLTGNGKNIGTPAGFRRKETKGGTLFIEKRGRRLSTRGETSEILSAKRSKF